MRAVQILGALRSAENCWICQLLGGFLLSCYMDLSKLIHGFDKVVTQICQSCYMFFLLFAKQNQADV